MQTTTEFRWTSADSEVLSDNGKRYEVIDGEVSLSDVSNWFHQQVCGRILSLLGNWSDKTKIGEAVFAPGIIFDKSNEVAPDVIWISFERRKTALADDGKLHEAPELVIEVVSPGWQNARRDRETKLKLYSRRGVSEYWVIDWVNKKIEVFRRENAALRLIATLFPADVLESPLLPDFKCSVADVFHGV